MTDANKNTPTPETDANAPAAPAAPVVALKKFSPMPDAALMQVDAFQRMFSPFESITVPVRGKRGGMSWKLAKRSDLERESGKSGVELDIWLRAKTDELGRRQVAAAQAALDSGLFTGGSTSVRAHSVGFSLKLAGKQAVTLNNAPIAVLEATLATRKAEEAAIAKTAGAKPAGR